MIEILVAVFTALIMVYVFGKNKKNILQFEHKDDYIEKLKIEYRSLQQSKKDLIKENALLQVKLNKYLQENLDLVQQYKLMKENFIKQHDKLLKSEIKNQRQKSQLEFIERFKNHYYDSLSLKTPVRNQIFNTLEKLNKLIVN